jgi:hypothetical protein
MTGNVAGAEQNALATAGEAQAQTNEVHAQ